MLPDPSPGAFVICIRKGSGDDKCDLDFGDMQLGCSSRRDERHLCYSNIQGLASRVGLPTPDNGLDVYHLASFGLHGLIVIELRRDLTSE